MPLPTLPVVSGRITPKDPADVDYYGFDFSALLAACGDTLSAATPALSWAPGDLDVMLLGVALSGPDAGTVFVEISGGNPHPNGTAQGYRVACMVQTTAGRTLSRPMIVPVGR